MRQVLFLLLLFIVGATALAQPVITPRNMALGGGGSTYITDYNANFYNPANLVIRDNVGDFSIGFGVSGALFSPFQSFEKPMDQLDHALAHLKEYGADNAFYLHTNKEQLLDDNYPSNATLSDNTFRYDMLLFGIKWKKKHRSFSLAVRTRTSSNVRVGKGWYSSDFIETNDENYLLDRSVIHRYQTLHEISFGYAETFKFLTGLSPRLDNFIIGIAPKLVLSGNYQNATWNNTYRRASKNGPTQHIRSFTYDVAGEFGLPENNSAQTPSQPGPFDAFYTGIDGIGAGLDIGVTYLLTLGSDLSAVRPNQQPTHRSLRVSFSMTDIGFVAYGGNTASFNASADTLAGVQSPGTTINEQFTGSKGQFIPFLNSYGEYNPFLQSTKSTSSFSTLLPMALHGGALLEINRLKLMGDISVGLTNNAFNSTKLTSSLGLELRPLKFMPLRGGIRFKAHRPDFISVGTAIETKKWDFSVAATFLPTSITGQPTFTGISTATLQFHF